jgi:hypothetical protein
MLTDQIFTKFESLLFVQEDIVKHFFYSFYGIGSPSQNRSRKGFKSGAPEGRFLDFNVVRNYVQYDSLWFFKKILQISHNIVRRKKRI